MSSTSYERRPAGSPLCLARPAIHAGGRVPRRCDSRCWRRSQHHDCCAGIRRARSAAAVPGGVQARAGHRWRPSRSGRRHTAIGLRGLAGPAAAVSRHVADSYWQQRLIGIVIGILATLAVALGSVGMYGVMAYAAAERTHEIGVRMALGASATSVLRLHNRSGSDHRYRRRARRGVLAGGHARDDQPLVRCDTA